MESTVFDFKFVLKHVDRQFYILDSKTILLNMDYRIVEIGDQYVDFTMASSFRMKYSVDSVFGSFSEYCQNNVTLQCKSLFYMSGAYGYANMFALDQESGFNYKPEYLMRDSNFVDVLAGRGFSNGVFFHNQQRYLVRGHSFTELISEELLLTHAHELLPIEGVIDIPRQMYIGLQESTKKISAATLARAKILGLDSRYMRVIENDYSENYHLFSEKSEYPLPVTTTIALRVVNYVANINGFRSTFSIEVAVGAHDLVDLSGLYFKYAIISINNLIIADEMYSKNSRFTANKGVE